MSAGKTKGTTPPRIARGSRETTGEALLDAAAALMSERDTLDVPLADIALRASANVALIKYYFGDKEGMLLALALRDAAPILKEFERLVAREDLDPVEKLRRHIVGLVATYYRFPYLDGLLRALLGSASTPTRTRLVETYLRPVSRLQAQLLRQAEAAGAISHTDPTFFHLVAAGACHYPFWGKSGLRHVFEKPGVTDEVCRRYAKFVADMIVTGLAPA